MILAALAGGHAALSAPLCRLMGILHHIWKLANLQEPIIRLTHAILGPLYNSISRS